MMCIFNQIHFIESRHSYAQRYRPSRCFVLQFLVIPSHADRELNALRKEHESRIEHLVAEYTDKMQVQAWVTIQTHIVYIYIYI